MSFKPTLAATIDPMKEPDVLSRLPFPLIVSPKYDGIRGIGIDGWIKSRTLLPLPSAQVQNQFGGLNHFDGEVIAGDPCDGNDVYNRTQSYVMSKDKIAPDLRYYVFDWADPELCLLPFEERYDLLKLEVEKLNRQDVILVEQRLVNNLEEFLAAEEEYLARGFEGIMGRKPGSKYKHGRSTFKEAVLLKLKRFEDFEAVVTGFIEQMTNTNAAEQDELGHTKRSSAKDGLVPADTLGKFICDMSGWGWGEEAEIPCGVLTHKQRKEIWDKREELRGKLMLKIRHFPFGAKSGLRLPRTVGIRDLMDM